MLDIDIVLLFSYQPKPLPNVFQGTTIRLNFAGGEDDVLACLSARWHEELQAAMSLRQIRGASLFVYHLGHRMNFL